MPPKKETLATRSLLIVRIKETLELANIASIDSTKLPLFKIKFRLLDEIYSEFQSIHIQVVSQLPSSELEEHDQIRKEVDDYYLHIVAKFEQLVPSDLSTNREGFVAHSPAPSNVENNIRLPKLELKKFSGDLNNWQTFIDIFNASVHESLHISDINKFQYLIASLSDEPLTLVKSLPLTAANYQVAYNTLVKRYSNKRLLTLHHWRAIKNYPSLTNDNYKNLRKLIDTFCENISVLKNLEYNVKEWDFVLTDLLLEKIDAGTRKRFELNSDATVIPRFDDLKEFLLKQCIALETVSDSNISKDNASQKVVKASNSQNPTSKSWKSSKSFVVNTQRSASTSSGQSSSSLSCFECKGSHVISRCPTFLGKTPLERFKRVKELYLCINCLKRSHKLADCPSNTCRTCSKRHHALLHFDRNALNSNNSRSDSVANQPPSRQGDSQSSLVDNNCATTSVSLITQSPKTTVLLATVSFEIKNKWGNFCPIRALLDPGSQSSFITESAVRNLGLTRLRNDTSIFGLGHTPASQPGGITTCQIRPRGSSQPLLDLDVLIIKTICFELPSSTLDSSQLADYKNLPLADPSFDKPGPIHMLLGADIYPSIVTGSTLKRNMLPKSPIALETIFGWTFVGPIESKPPSYVHSFHISIEPCTDAVLKRFWEIEEVPSNIFTSEEDNIAEKVFQTSHFRISNGRFGVSLPFKIDSPQFENSRRIADRRFVALERRLQSQPLLRQLYLDFMQDYLSSGHMTLINTPSGDDNYFIPHHGVLTSQGNSQKLRVVFDASAKADNHLSLNDTLYSGPKLQADIGKILLRFRAHNIVFTCDIRQMYRQILIAPDHRKYQLIRWRFNPDDPISTYQLNTVTYGVNASPYLAIRTLLQLAEDEKEQFPLAAESLKRDIYVDDLVCGSSTLENAIQLRNQIISLLQSGCFELRKWSSNHPSLLEDIPLSHRQQFDLTFDSDSESTIKILGLQWHAKSDSFSFKVIDRDSVCTKRSILSEVARIYDPLGFLSPLTLFAKRLLQHLWYIGIDWDEAPPEDVQTAWKKYKSEISVLSSLKIPRCLSNTSLSSCQLHAFCDASEYGFACVIYFRISNRTGPSVYFVIAKSKVAPLKQLSIPRLELCAALLLARLVDFVIKSYQNLLSFEKIVAWSDSTVALTWIRSSPHRWKSFVANRVSLIQDLVPPVCWRYVPSEENAADPASRGLLPNGVLSCSLWWAGPTFLSQPPDKWPVDSNSEIVTSDLEEKSIVLVAQTRTKNVLTILSNISSFRKIQGIFAYILRFIHNVRSPDKIKGLLSAQELHQALLRIVKLVQAEVFRKEISDIRNNQKCPKYLRKLSPFVDLDGILRVGGRLSKSDLSYSAKHPALLPRKHRITKLIVLQVHNTNFHSGINTTMYLIQQNFWILSARRTIRHYLASCNRCFRTRPTSYTPLMGDLPRPRISQAKAFSCVGVDYAGPFNVTMGKGRGVKAKKAYLCLFVCFVTKAIHLELASDLSTEAFLGALRRFVARRGRCSYIFSDCGTNFVGASRELNKYMKTCVEAENISWNFNPPSAPHFGGLWESGVKAVKTHLYRVIGNQTLTYEEMNTLFVQIESLLNSRPLCSLSSDPNDLTVLTPGHFLTLEPLTAPPDPDLSHLSMNRLSRWQLVQQMQQSFWGRWKNEYLHDLYQRSKWSKSHILKPVNIGTLVLIKDNLSPPLKWKIGKIVSLHPGTDGVARVASVQTTQGIIKRPLVKLCALPSQ